MHTSEPLKSVYIWQMFSLGGFSTLRLAEDFCPGFPLHSYSASGDPIYSGPQTSTQALERALIDFDSAVSFSADSSRYLNLARVGRGRTLLGLGRFAEAAASVASVPTTFVWNVEMRVGGGVNPHVFTRTSSNSRRSVADRKGGNGLDYVSANDPRVTTTVLGTAYDGVTVLRSIGKYPVEGSPIVQASGIEARLIEAEAALSTGSGDWLGILNNLRQTQVTPALTALTDPGSDAQRVDLLLRE